MVALKFFLVRPSTTVKPARGLAKILRGLCGLWFG
jgi:hypothetical protein